MHWAGELEEPETSLKLVSGYHPITLMLLIRYFWINPSLHRSQTVRSAEHTDQQLCEHSPSKRERWVYWVLKFCALTLLWKSEPRISKGQKNPPVICTLRTVTGEKRLSHDSRTKDLLVQWSGHTGAYQKDFTACKPSISATRDHLRSLAMGLGHGFFSKWKTWFILTLSSLHMAVLVQTSSMSFWKKAHHFKTKTKHELNVLP